jgi:hypothetical protein
MAWARTSFRSGAEKVRQIPKRPPAVAFELTVSALVIACILAFARYEC